jgi:hypothetical protein
MRGEVLAAFLHLEQNDARNDEIGKRGELARLLPFGDAVFGDSAGFERPSMTKRPQQAIHENLRFPFFVSGAIGSPPVHECLQRLDESVVHIPSSPAMG